jgi:hypothetical protein
VFRVGVEEGIDMVSKDQTCSDTMKEFNKGSAETVTERRDKGKRDRVLNEV